MLRFVLARSPAKRLARGVPLLALLAALDAARLAQRHLTKLSPAERRRLLALAAKARGGAGAFSGPERAELGALLAKLEPRTLVGAVADRLSPVPLPKRLLYGSKSRRLGEV